MPCRYAVQKANGLPLASSKLATLDDLYFRGIFPAFVFVLKALNNNYVPASLESTNIIPPAPGLVTPDISINTEL